MSDPDPKPGEMIVTNEMVADRTSPFYEKILELSTDEFQAGQQSEYLNSVHQQLTSTGFCCVITGPSIVSVYFDTDFESEDNDYFHTLMKAFKFLQEPGEEIDTTEATEKDLELTVIYERFFIADIRVQGEDGSVPDLHAKWNYVTQLHESMLNVYQVLRAG